MRADVVPQAAHEARVVGLADVGLAVQIGADTNRAMSHQKLRAILDTMVAHEIYPIARIVVAKGSRRAR